MANMRRLLLHRARPSGIEMRRRQETDLIELHTQDSTDLITHVALVGTFDMTSVEQIKTELMAATVERELNTIVDLSQLSFIASMGMEILVTVYKGLKRNGAKIVLLNPHHDVESVIRTARLQDILPIAHSEEEAQRFFAAS
jgi:anti-sigma B factor antagonist